MFPGTGYIFWIFAVISYLQSTGSRKYPLITKGILTRGVLNTSQKKRLHKWEIVLIAVHIGEPHRARGRADSFERTLMLGKVEGGRRRGWQRMRWLGGITHSVDMSLENSGSWWWTARPGVRQSQSSRKASDTVEWLNWTEPFN